MGRSKFLPKLSTFPGVRSLFAKAERLTLQETLFKLIQDAGTLRQVQAFLQERGLPYSASSWEGLFAERIVPALRKGKLLESDLLKLLSESEEFGRQHVFLYRRRSGSMSLPDQAALRQALRGTPDEEVLTGPRILEYPDFPTLAEVRRDPGPKHDSITYKVIETRIHTRLIDEHEEAGNRFTRVYQREAVRAVNCARLHADGFLELRIYSHRSHARDYTEDLTSLWGRLSGLLDPKHFTELSLVTAKQALWEQRNKLNGRIRFSDAELRNTVGTSMSCRTGTAQKNLFDDESADAGLTVFMEDGEAVIEGHDVWWVQQDRGLPSRDIHVLMSGEPNEFAVTQQCTPEDYEHVLADIRRLNR